MKNSWKYIDFYDLVSSQIEVTRLSYDTHSSQYAEDWEWNKKIVDITRKDYMEPLFKNVKKGGVILVVGCGTGRDLNVLREKGYKYLGIDTSEGMLKEAVEKRKVDGPLLCESLETVNLAELSFNGVLVDSAIEHIKKSDMKQILEKLYICLKSGGVALLRFREGSGKVFLVEDSVGTRYFNSYAKKESKELVMANGFKIVDEFITKHMDNSRPGFHTYILRK